MLCNAWPRAKKLSLFEALSNVDATALTVCACSLCTHGLTESERETVSVGLLPMFVFFPLNLLKVNILRRRREQFEIEKKGGTMGDRRRRRERM
jgi:hypothetical protein